MNLFIRLLVALGLIVAAPAYARQNCSGTTGAGATTVYSASNTRGVVIINNSASMMCISFDGTAATGAVNCASGSFPLQPASGSTAGGSYMSPEGYSPTFMSIVSAGGAGGIYSCERW